jgi:hypothetical protein
MFLLPLANTSSGWGSSLGEVSQAYIVVLGTLLYGDYTFIDNFYWSRGTQYMVPLAPLASQFLHGNRDQSFQATVLF